MFSYNIELNIKQTGAIETGIELTQGDFGEVCFIMRVKDNDEYVIGATAAEIVFSLPNGYVVTGEVVVDVGTYIYTFSGNELQSAGKVVCVLTLTFSDGRISSCGFTFNCRYNPLYDRRIQAGPYIAELERIKKQAQAQVDYIKLLIQQLQSDLGETVLTRGDLVNNGLATIAGVAALDAAMGKVLCDADEKNANAIDQQNIKIGDVSKLPGGAMDIVTALIQANSNLENVDVRTDYSGTYSILVPIGKPQNGYDGTNNVHIFFIPFLGAHRYNVSFETSFVVQGIEIIDPSRIRGPIVSTSGIRGEIIADNIDLTSYYLNFSIVLALK